MRLDAAPAEARFDRVALRGQVLAVQVEADLEPQRVAGAEAAGDDAGVEQLRPDRRRDLGVDQQLDPVLAGVAGAAGERRPAADADDGDPHPRRQLDAERRGDDRARVRALDGEHRVAVGDVADGDVVAAAPAPEPGEVRVVVGRVGDEQVAVAAEPVGEEVVEDAAALVAQARVLGAAELDRGDVVGERQLQEARARPGPRPRPRPCGRRRTSPRASAPRRAPRGSPHRRPASPSRRRGRSSPRAHMASRREASASGRSQSSHAEGIRTVHQARQSSHRTRSTTAPDGRRRESRAPAERLPRD